MKLSDAQKNVISNIFRDLTKLAVAALVIAPLVPGGKFVLQNFFYGLLASFILMFVAVFFAVNNKEG